MNTGFSLRALLALSIGLFSVAAQSAEELELVELINDYRSQSQRCETQASEELPPLAVDTRLILPASGQIDLQGSLALSGYPMKNVQAITLSGPRDAQTALKTLQESFCKVLLNPQFVDIAVGRADRDWRIVLAQPLIKSRLPAWQEEGQKLLEQVNLARKSTRQCGELTYAAAEPLQWNTTLADVAQEHSRAMANGNFFAHKGSDGRTPGDRAELAGYEGLRIAENIAAGQDAVGKVVQGWLASPSHCVNVMNPQYRELGAAYAIDPKSDAGIYWTAMFGSP